MRPVLHRLCSAAGIAALVCASAAGSILSLAAPATAYLAPGVSPAVSDFASCLEGQHKGDILLLIDESTSLHITDPHAARVSAAKYLVSRLERTSQLDGFKLSVAIAGFAGLYYPTLGWTALSPESLPTIDASLNGFRNKDNGFDTDYWLALNGARQALAERTTALGGSTRCQAVVWFTDGEIDIAPRLNASELSRYGATEPYSGSLRINGYRAAANAQMDAITDLCRPGGLADQVRAAGVKVFAIGLQGPGPRQDFRLLTSIATGRASNFSNCGSILQPSPGLFRLASNLDSLLFAFDAIGSPGEPPLVRIAGICQRTLCAQYAHTFTLDASIDSVYILGTSSITNADVVLQGPESYKTLLNSHREGLTRLTDSDVAISYSWLSLHTLVINLSASSGARGWPGQWSITFLDPSGSSPHGKSESAIHIFGDLFPTWYEPATLRAGRTTEIHIGLVNSRGKPINPASLLSQVSLSASLTRPDGGTSPVATDLTKASLSRPVALDLRGIGPGLATMHLTLHVTTASARGPHGQVEPGTALEPRLVALPFEIAPPPRYPTIATSVDFGSASGKVDLTGKLQVVGPGCSWYAGSPKFTAVPSGMGRVNIVAATAFSRAHCLILPAGKVGDIKLRLTAQHPGNGGISGYFPVETMPAGGGAPVEMVRSSFSANVQTVLNQFHFWLALIIVALLGPGVPLFLLYGVKWLMARIPPAALYAQSFPVNVSSDGLVLRDGAEFGLHGSDLVRHFVQMPRRGARVLDADGVKLRTKTGWRPTSPGYVVAEAPGAATASPDYGVGRGGGLWARLPLAVHNRWVVVYDPSLLHDEARVLMLVRADSPPEQRYELEADVRRRLPDILARLRRRADEAHQGQRTTPSAAGRREETKAASVPFGLTDGTSGEECPENDPFGLDDR